MLYCAMDVLHSNTSTLKTNLQSTIIILPIKGSGMVYSRYGNLAGIVGVTVWWLGISKQDIATLVVVLTH